MAEPAVVSALIETFTSMLADRVLEEASLITNFKKDFEFLCDELFSVKLLLDEAGQSSTSRSMCNWLEKLEYFLIDAVDMVEECRASSIGNSIFSNFEKLIFRYKMGCRIRTLKQRINHIHGSAKYLKHLMLVLQANALNAHNLEDKRERSSALLKESHIVGINHHIANITEIILKEKGPQVIAVVGMGGIGKTLLVERVVKSRVVQESFDHVVWLAVPQNFDMEHLLPEINKKMKHSGARNQNMTTGQTVRNEDEGKILEDIIKSDRCLFVLDDIWNEDDFYKLGSLLDKATKIIVTTRHKRAVCRIFPDQQLELYPMKYLSPQNSKKLFCIHAFPDHGERQQSSADTEMNVPNQPQKELSNCERGERQQSTADTDMNVTNQPQKELSNREQGERKQSTADTDMNVPNQTQKELSDRERGERQQSTADTDMNVPNQFQKELSDLELGDRQQYILDTYMNLCNPLHRELMAIADKIVQKCGGLPLALKTIGASMARVRRLPNDWESVLKRLNEAEAMNDQVWPSLRLSYQALPYHLKLCFDYCSSFPKNSRIKSEYLVNAWIAEGFTPRSAENPYDVGLSYINELTDRSLLEVSKVGGDERVKYCKMHDMLHDLAHSESHKKTKCLLKPGQKLQSFPENQSGLRRISLIANNISNITAAIECPGLRTLLLCNNVRVESISARFFDDMKYLAVLDLSGTSIESLPETVSHLKHLKLLNLSKTKIATLPKSLAELRSLQFLDVGQCQNLREVHLGIGEHKSMLHLNVKGSSNLEWLPVGISKLIYLHTLKGPVFKMEKEPNSKALQVSTVLKWGKAANAKALQWWDLKRLTLLQHLSLTLEAPSSQGIIQLEEGTFASMTNMRALSFKYTDSPPQGSSGILKLPKDIESMHRLEILHLKSCVMQDWIFRLQNLMELELYGDNSSTLDYEGLRNIPNLRKLKLSSNVKCHNFPEKFAERGAFPKLEKFVIKHFDTLENFPSLEHGAFPMLKSFQMKYCRKLKDITGALQKHTSIEEIRVKECEGWEDGIRNDQGTWQLFEIRPVKLTINGYTINWALGQTENSKLYAKSADRKLRSLVLVSNVAARFMEAGTSSAEGVA